MGNLALNGSFPVLFVDSQRGMILAGDALTLGLGAYIHVRNTPQQLSGISAYVELSGGLSSIVQMSALREADSLLLERQHMETDISVFHVGEYPAPTRCGQSLFLPALRGHFQKRVERLTRMLAGLENCPSWVVLQYPPWGSYQEQPN